MPRDLDRYIEKVEDSLVKLQDIITALRHADRLDPDDEFEVEYGIDSLVKSVKKVGKICERYKPNEVHVERNDAKVKEAKVDAKVTRTSPVVPVSSRANGVSSPQDKARTASPQQKKSPAISQLKQKASPASSKQSKSLQSSYEDLMSPAGTPVKAVVPQSPELVDSGDESDATCDYDKGKHITQEALVRQGKMKCVMNSLGLSGAQSLCPQAWLKILWDSLTFEAETKWQTFPRRHFQMHFLE